MKLSRRSLLALGVGTLGLPAGVRAAEPGLPTLDMLDSERLVERSGLEGRATIEQLGESRGGRRIDLISVGSGSRSALIVGAPHPNEPIGCLTIARMLKRLGADTRHREESGYRWSFIAAIDPDGIALNQPWFTQPLTVESYCRSFYRPPFARQPEYSFPLDAGGRHFTQSTPENLAWQRALSLTRPHLQCSLHGADSGGAFFICSRNLPALSRRLAQLPTRYALPLNPVGEPFSDMDAFQPGVMAFFDIPAMLEKSSADGTDPNDIWDAGDSSNGYAQSRFRTFSMTCEVPLWNDARSADARKSAWSTADTLEAQIRVYAEDRALLEESLPRLRRADAGFEADALLASLEEALSQALTQPAQLQKLKASQDAAVKLSYRDLVQYEPGTAAWRPPAMLSRLAHLLGEHATAAAAESLLHRRQKSQQRAGALTPVALGASTSLQMASIEAAARSIGAADEV